ncbi:MAG TPA: Lrp/AsnC family transcriptional regulator [Alphaproteobacteria bacterium]|nr:Lrp/AsnC family transcriptional regulator [Alphaproteobacteria bacterium]
MELDTIDHRILEELQANARISNLELAKRVALSPSACSRRVQALEKAGVIKGYRAIVDDQALGIGLTVIVQIGLQHHDDEALEAFETAVRNSPNIIACDMISGRDDYLLRIGARDLMDYERIHREQLSRLPGVTRIESSFAFRKVVG